MISKCKILVNYLICLPVMNGYILQIVCSLMCRVLKTSSITDTNFIQDPQMLAMLKA